MSECILELRHDIKIPGYQVDWHCFPRVFYTAGVRDGNVVVKQAWNGIGEPLDGVRVYLRSEGEDIYDHKIE